MKTELVDLKNATDPDWLKKAGYQYAWIQSENSVMIGTLDDVKIDHDLLLEARIFSNEKEIHVFTYDDELRAVLTEHEKDDHVIERKQLLRRRFGKTVTVRHYVGYEEDGQAFIQKTVLCGYEGGMTL